MRRARGAIVVACVLALPACSGADRAATTAAAPGSSPATTAPTTTSVTTAPTSGATDSSGATVASDPDVEAAPTEGDPVPQGLQGVVDAFVARQPVPFSVVAVHLTTGARAEHLADRSVLSASLYKLFVARELLRRIDDGELAGTDAMGDAQGRTFDACIAAMIEVSDNACGEAGLERVGYGALDPSIHAAGYGATSLATPQRTSAADVALFLERARAGTVVGSGHERASAALYGMLRRQQVNDRLPVGLPPGTPIAHKTGDRYGWAHDAGVITTPAGDVVLAVLSGPWAYPCCDADRPGPAEVRAFGAIASLATAVYDEMT